MKKNLTLLLLFVTCIFSAQVTIFPNGSAWKYLDNGTDPGTTWTANSFNDAAWSSGNGELGYGDGDEATVVNACGTVTTYPSCTNKYPTTYFRRAFTMGSTASYTAYTINLKRDDGIIVYINGTQVYSDNMPSSGITYTTWASTTCSDDGATIWSATIPASVITTGTNVISAEIHQANGSSSDISFELNLVGMTAAITPTLVKGPYLQIGTQSSMVVRWESSVATDSKVQYGTNAASLNLTATNTLSSVTHTVQLSNLTPYTKYYYNVGSSTLVTQGDTNNYFLTSPVPGTPGKYRFWVVGDCGNASTNQINCRNQFKTYNGNKPVNGMLLSGDNAYNSGLDAEYNTEFFGIYSADQLKNMPLWSAPGNHDYNNGASTATTVTYFQKFMGPTQGEAGGVASNSPAYYSFDYGNIHFLALDSYGTTGAAQKMYDTTGAQVTWIKQDLAANTKKWTIAYWHHPPYTMGSHNSDTESDLVAIRQKFIKILERNKVDMIICGHSHDYERSKLMNGHYGAEATFSASVHNLSTSSGKYDGSTDSCPYTKDSTQNKIGTVYVLSGSAGQLGGQQSSFPHDAMYYSNATNGGTFILDIEDNKLDAKWLCADGSIRDNFTMYKDVKAKNTYTVLPAQVQTLTASWPGTYVWGNTTTARTLTVSALADSTIWVKDPNSCVADTFKLKVLPTVNFSAIPPYCASAPVTFTDLSTNNTSSWSWSVSPATGVNFSSSSAKNPNITFNTAGTYTVSMIAGNLYGSGSVTTKTVVINALPNVVSALSSSAICINQSATLTASGASSYSWTAGGTNTLVSVNPTLTTTYTLIGTDANGCKATSISTLIVNALPVVTAISTPTAAICTGGTVMLNSSGASTYSWTGGITNNNSFSLTAGASYTVTGTDANGCQNTATAAISVNALPVLTVAVTPTNASVCSGSSLALTASGAISYVWNGTISNGVSFAPASSGVYTVMGTDANGCIGTQTQSITVNALPVIMLAGSNTVCLGSTTTLTPSGASSYSLSSTNLNMTTVNTFTVAPIVGQSYTVTGINANGCISILTASLTVNALPLVAISGNMVLCAGQTATITPAGALSYNWNNSTNGNLVIAPQSGTNYTVTGTDANGCKNTASTHFTVNPLPTVNVNSSATLVCVGETATLSVSGANTYMWNTTAAAATITVSPLQTTSYSVTGTNANSCSSSASIVQNVSQCTGLEKITSDIQTLIYPNPNKGVFNIELNTQGNFTADIYNALGERVYSAKLDKGTTNVQLNQTKGIYFYVILNGSQVQERGKIVIE